LRALWGGCTCGGWSGRGVGVLKILVPIAVEDIQLLLCRFDDFAILSPRGGKAVVVPSREGLIAVGALCLFSAVGTKGSNMLVYASATNATISKFSALSGVVETLTARVMASDYRFLVN
jgi:hypothetical protein